MNSYGVYQNAYKTEVPEFRDSSTLAISLSDVYGPRTVGICGGLIMCGSLVLASFTNNLWQLMITQGFLFGMSTSLSHIPGLGAIAGWFDKRRGLANGIAVAGGGVGGFALGPFLRLLLTQVGWRWTLRIIGIMAGTVICISALFLRPRIKKHASLKLDLSLFKDSMFVRLYAVCTIQAFAYFIPFFFLPNNGMTKEQGALLVGITNGSSAVGRIALGLTSDFFGSINSLATCFGLTALSILLIWPFATSFGLLTFFSIFCGFVVGGFVSVMPAVIAKLFGHRGNVSTTIGLTFSGFLLGNLFGSPIAGAILDLHTTYSSDGQKSVNFIPAIMYTGVCLSVSTLIILSIKYSAGNGRFFIKV
eukprot:jgi/Hompol1/3012/HPOL_006294-RA